MKRFIFIFEMSFRIDDIAFEFFAMHCGIGRAKI